MGETVPLEWNLYRLNFFCSGVFHTQTWLPHRYADVVVHRLLAAALGLEPLPDSARDRWVWESVALARSAYALSCLNNL